ncbi:MAG TPA: thiol reductant ABC exporter subunit CydD [Spirochaetia bacterium]|nr:thiol reductant ABC exporter subunit CydD [Spirochaetia bacterium]
MRGDSEAAAGGARWLRDQGRPARGRLALTVALGEAAGVLLVLQTGLLARVADGAIFRRGSLPALLPLLLEALIVIGVRAVTTWASKRAASACASQAKDLIRSRCLEQLRRLGPIPLAGMRAGEIANTAVDAVEALDAYYSRYLPQRAIASLLPLTILAVIFPLDWLSGLVLVLTAVFLPLSMIVIGEEAHERNRRLWGTLAQMSGRFLDVLQGLATVRMFNAAARETRQIQEASDQYRALTLSVLRVAFLSSFMLELISAVSIAIVAVLTGFRLLSGSMSFLPGYFILLIAPEYFLTLRVLGTFYHSRMEAVSAAEKIRELLSLPVPDRAHAPAVAVRLSAAPSVGFQDVTFSYEGRSVLSGASFRIPPGEHVALMGESGAGKTTVLLLLLGFAAPRSGTIDVDGQPLGALDADGWRAGVAWLPQRPTLFHGSVLDNIRLGSANATRDEVLAAARLAHVDEFLPRLSHGLDTRLGEGGQGLSVGQAQRVALARLFLRQPRVVLLDEPTAHLDDESARLVTEGIQRLCAGRTTLLVTHREATAAFMGRVIRISDGRIREAPP